MKSYNSGGRKEVLTQETIEKYGPGVRAALIEMRKDYQKKAVIADIQERKSNSLAREFHAKR